MDGGVLKGDPLVVLSLTTGLSTLRRGVRANTSSLVRALPLLLAFVAIRDSWWQPWGALLFSLRVQL